MGDGGAAPHGQLAAAVVRGVADAAGGARQRSPPAERRNRSHGRRAGDPVARVHPPRQLPVRAMTDVLPTYRDGVGGSLGGHANRPLRLLSVVAPIYNEEALIEEFYGRVCRALQGL